MWRFEAVRICCMPPRLDISFCTTPDGVSLAYACTGTGPPLVKAANWLSHLDFDQESPVWRHYIEAFSSRFSYLRYDERGCGLSDWNVPTLSFEDWVADLETVVDAAGFKQFPLLGISQGGAVAIEYAIRHPERVSHLILYGAYTRGRLGRGEAARKEWELQRRLVEVGWGTDHTTFRHVFTKMFIPGGTSTQHAWFDELMRRSVSTENALRFLETFGTIDVSARAPLVQVPTLILHATGDQRVPFSEGRLLASIIPGARLVPLESENHILLEHEPAWRHFLSELVGFISDGEDQPEPSDDRNLTLLMTDIADSTRLIEVIGDEAWVDLLAWHDATLRSRFDAHRGREIDHTGDGFLVSFSSPLDAVRCAVDIQATLRSHRKAAGFAPRIRIGVNVGPVALHEGTPRGREVHLTARIMAVAGADEIIIEKSLASVAEDVGRLGEVRTIEAKGIAGDVEVVDLRWS